MKTVLFFYLLFAAVSFSSSISAWITAPTTTRVAVASTIAAASTSSSPFSWTSTTALHSTRNNNAGNNNNNNNSKRTGDTGSAAGTTRDTDFMRWAKSSRSAQADDRMVELVRPLGLILAQDERGNVFVETVAPRGNAARSGKIQEGDIITMCSATFGDDMWSTRGVGLNRVLAAIRVRSGATVRLVVESPNQYQAKKMTTAKQLKAQEEAVRLAQAKKDALLAQLEQDEEKLKNKWFRLF